MKWVLAAALGAMVVASCGPGASDATGTAAPGSSAVSTATATSATTSTTPTTTAGGGQLMTTVVSDCGTGAYRPAEIVVTCGDGAVVATQIQWSAWSPAQASGTAVVEVNSCRPTCSSSEPRPYPGKLLLSHRVSTSSGPHFAQLVVTWTGQAPFGQPTNTYPLKTAVP